MCVIPFAYSFTYINIQIRMDMSYLYSCTWRYTLNPSNSIAT